MKRILSTLIFVQCVAVSASAFAESNGPLDFDTPLTVYTAPKNNFAQIESSGRRSIAVSGETVAVVWTVSSKTTSTIFVAYRLPGNTSFSSPVKINRQALAYEPSISGVSGGRFIVGWEEEKKVWLRIVSPEKNGVAVQVGTSLAKQVSVDSNGKDSAVVWSQGNGKRYSIYSADLHINGHRLSIGPVSIVDNSKDNHAQFHPVVALTTAGRVVGWEDRRDGLTTIVTAFAPTNKPFAPYQLLNHYSSSPNRKFGRGSGAMRIALSSDQMTVAAAWLDKRNWRSGYDVFASQSLDGGKTFSGNELAQDQFAENLPQWHASVALQTGGKVTAVAWDDKRNDTPDVFYSLRRAREWSDDFELPGADGPGQQSHPSIIFDQQGRLHAVWQSMVNGVTQVRYVRTTTSQ